MSAKIDWSRVRLPWFERVELSPEVEPGFEGVRLRVPQVVSLSETDGRVPVFGVVQLTEKRMEELGIADRHPVRAVVVGSVATEFAPPYVGNAVLQAPLFPGPASGPVTEYFSVDLAECTGLPRAPGALFVFASVGPLIFAPTQLRLVP